MQVKVSLGDSHNIRYPVYIALYNIVRHLDITRNAYYGTPSIKLLGFLLEVPVANGLPA